MTQLTPHFTREELACPHCGQMLIPIEFIEKLEKLRVKLGFPLPISSGYRCSEYNQQLTGPDGTGPNGPHTIRAVDVGVQGEQAYKLVAVALLAGFTGIGVKQKGDRRCIHLDDLPDAPNSPRPRIWSY